MVYLTDSFWDPPVGNILTIRDDIVSEYNESRFIVFPSIATCCRALYDTIQSGPVATEVATHRAPVDTAVSCGATRSQPSVTTDPCREHRQLSKASTSGLASECEAGTQLCSMVRQRDREPSVVRGPRVVAPSESV